MKFRSTCSICLSKIKIIDLSYGSKRMGPGLKLLCNHIFHAACIANIHKKQCPLCEHPIFNNDEETLLMCTSEEVAIDILKNLHERDINVKNVFTFLITHPSAKKYKWIVHLMYKYCDFTDLLADNLNNKHLVKEIVAKCKVNWFKTFCGGLTFYDLVYNNTNDPEIISLVRTKLPMKHNKDSHDSKDSIIRPRSVLSFATDPGTDTMTHSVTHPMTPTTHSVTHSVTHPMIPVTDPVVKGPITQTYQRHRRMDSSSGAALEHELWGLSGLRFEPVAGIRRSLRVSRSDKDGSVCGVCEQKDMYPIYERIYPVLPSAPSLEEILM